MVSVIIPSYNRYDLLLHTIESVKNQTYKHIEIIVVDDYSTDRRYDELIHRKDIIFLRSYENTGNPSTARNIAIQKSQGEVIAFVDDDDQWLPNKVERQLKLMEQNNAFFSCTEGYYTEEDYVYNPEKNYPLYMKEHYAQFIKTNTGKDKLPKWICFSFNRRHNYIITSSVMIHRSLIDKVGQFVSGGLYVKYEDWSYWLRCMEHRDCLFIDEPLMFYGNAPRLHNISHKILEV